MERLTQTVVKQAYQLAKSNKFFWQLGLFLVWINLGKSFLTILYLMSLFAPESLEGVNSQAAGSGNMWVGAVGLVFIIIMTILYFRSKAFLMWAVKELKDKNQLDKEVVREQAEPHTIMLMKFGLSFGILTLLAAFTLTGPLVYLTSNQYESQATAVGVTSILISLPIFFAIYLASIFSSLFVGVHDMSVSGSLRATLDLIRKKWLVMAQFTVLMVMLDMVSFIVSCILAVAAAIPFVLLIRIFYDMGGQAVLTGLAGIAAFMVFFMSQAWFTAWQKISWTLLFLEIAKPVKPEEAVEAQTVPEIVT
jgi:hypothetical protein